MAEEAAPAGQAWFEADAANGVVRIAVLDEQGRVVSERFYKIPLERDWDEVAAKLAQTYWDPCRPKTSPVPALSSLSSNFRRKR